MAGEGYPMIATHDPTMVDIGGALARRYGRAQGSYEYQMLFGIRPDEQVDWPRPGRRMRVYVPYGDEWYGYFMRRIAERPQNRCSSCAPSRRRAEPWRQPRRPAGGRDPGRRGDGRDPAVRADPGRAARRRAASSARGVPSASPS